MKLRCILYLPQSHRLASVARKLVSAEMDILAQVDADHLQSEDELAHLKPDYILSFLNPIILKGPLLEFPNINFHPAPPEYPGRGSASYALFDDAPQFGATAHRMVRKVDAGEIYLVRRFPIIPNSTCDEIFEKAEDLCVDLLKDSLELIAKRKLMPSSEKWQRAAGKRKDFEEWLILDPSKPDEFKKKIRAAKHPRFKGPYVYINGFRFCLDENGKSKHPG